MLLLKTLKNMIKIYKHSSALNEKTKKKNVFKKISNYSVCETVNTMQTGLVAANNTERGEKKQVF